MAIAAKASNLEDLRHSELASDLEQFLCLMCKEEIGILGIGTRNLFDYVFVIFMFFYVISY